MKRFIKNKRGQVRTIEALFASVLLLSSLALIQPTQKHDNAPTATLSLTALNVLVSLDNDGSLAKLSDARDWAGLRNIIGASLPPAVWFNLTVLDARMAPTNDVLITNGNAASDNVEAIDYVCVSTSGNYAVYFLRLQVSAAD